MNACRSYDDRPWYSVVPVWLRVPLRDAGSSKRSFFYPNYSLMAEYAVLGYAICSKSDYFLSINQSIKTIFKVA